MYKGHKPKDPWGKAVETVKFWKKKSRKCLNRARIVKNPRGIMNPRGHKPNEVRSS